jgi:pectin methylesterase-like acyl-CoA thioesterase
MKSFFLLGVVSLLVAPLVAMGQTTVFQDTFQSGNLSTLNPTAASPGTLTANRTAYEIASTKNASTTTVVAGALTLSTAATGSGYTEAQALFTTTPVTLSAAGQYIEFYYTFTNTANVFNGTAAANMEVVLGLYNSGGSAPTNGTLLWNGGLVSGSTTAVNGGCKGWVGYTADFGYSYASAISSRPAQAGANNVNQALGYNSGYASGANVTTMAAVTSQPTLTVGNAYTMHMRIYWVNSTTLAITNTLYNGAGIGGTIFSASGWAGQFGAQASSALTMTFDALEVGIRPNGSSATTLPISSITVAKYIPTAPTITGITNQTVIAGNTATLSATVGGTPTPGLQWYVSSNGGVSSNGISGATSSSDSFTAQQSQDGNIYYLVATNSQGTAVSSMTLSVISTPSISGLNDQSVATGATVTMSPTVSGVPTPAVQWQHGGTNVIDGATGTGSTIAGSTSGTLTITSAQNADSGTYFLIATNTAGKTTNSMLLTVSSSAIAPTISGLTNQTVIQGSNTTLNAAVSGSPVPDKQWYLSTDGGATSNAIGGAISASLALNSVTYSQNGYIYSLMASNSAGVTNSSMTLTVIVPPSISAQPTNMTVLNGGSASFSVTASGVPAPAYQWYKNGAAISSGSNNSATNATLNLATTVATDTGSTYYVVVSNAAGTVTSSTATLTVNSSMGYNSLTPANGATNVSYDTPLYVNFNSTPTLRAAGKIRIYNTNNSVTPVDTIDLSQCVTNNATYAANVQPYTIGGDAFTNFPVIITGTKAAIYPHHGLLTSNQTYYVTLDNGTFADSAGAYFVGITDTNAWRFTTKPTGPAVATNLMVAQDYSGDFATVQGAVDSIASGNVTPTLISIRNGSYTEIVNVKTRHNITFRGQSRAGTIVVYPNNSYVYGNTHERMTFKVNANGTALDNLTVSNSTPQDASQAEALMIESGATSNIVNNCNIDSYQDTILVNASSCKACFNNSLIQGDVDFIWGPGNLFFTNCEIRYLTRPGNASLGPNPSPGPSDATSNSYSFVSCRLTTLPGGNPADTIGRTRGYTNSQIVLISCMVSTNIGGWSSDASPTSSFRNWYYNCTNELGAAVTLSNGIALAANDPNIALASSATAWLYGWSPALSANIISQPVGQSVSHGQAANFAVSATSIPDPTYQWFLNGSPIVGATGAAFNIASAARTNGGNYSVVVSNSSGSVTSSVAVLTYNNTAPVAGNLAVTRNAGIYALRIAVGDLLTNVTDVDGDTITLVGTGASTNGVTVTTVTVSGTNYLNYYNTNNVNDQFTYTVTDGFGGTNSGLVSVTVSNAIVGPTGGAITSFTNNVANLTFHGIPNYSYIAERSTNLNLDVWVDIATNTAATNGVISVSDTFSDLGNVLPAAAYYRLKWQP